MLLKEVTDFLRVRQYSKNLLVFAPLVASHQLGSGSAWQTCGVAFVAFCLVASAGYVFNDLSDSDNDRKHPRKCLRAIPAGRVSRGAARALMAVLAISGLALATLFLPHQAAMLIGAYLGASLAYTAMLKRTAMLDVIVLAALYTCRILAGAAAIPVQPSFWLLAFSMFLFLSLALIKRYAESAEALADGRDWISGRGYRASDLPTVQSLGTASAMAATVVLALYIRSPEVESLYSRPLFLWALCPLVLYWTGRMWLKTQRGEILDDPLVFAVKDRTTYLVVATGAAAMAIATF